VALGPTFRTTGGYRKAQTSFLKGLTRRIFTIRKCFQSSTRYTTQIMCRVVLKKPILFFGLKRRLSMQSVPLELTYKRRGFVIPKFHIELGTKYFIYLTKPTQ
jgi:hypothetical protein